MKKTIIPMTIAALLASTSAHALPLGTSKSVAIPEASVVLTSSDAPAWLVRVIRGKLHDDDFDDDREYVGSWDDDDDDDDEDDDADYDDDDYDDDGYEDDDDDEDDDDFDDDDENDNDDDDDEDDEDDNDDD